MRRWLAVDVGITGVVMVAAVKPAALELVLVIIGVLSGLPLLFITMLVTLLAVVAVYSPHRARRGAAEKILDRLLTVVSRPHQQ